MNNAERLTRVKVAYEIMSRVFSDMCRNYNRGENDEIIDAAHEALLKILSVQKALMEKEGIC